MLDELSANCRAKGGAAKILEQLRFAVAIGDAHDHEAMDKHEFREYCADLVGSGSHGFVKMRRQIVQYVMAVPSAKADSSAHGRHGRREKPAMRQAKLPEHPTGGVQGRKRVIQRRFNVGVFEAIPKRKAFTL